MELDLDHLRQWIGREETAAEPVTGALLQRFNATFDCPAGAAPLMLHWCLAQPAVPTAGLGPDGHPARGGFLPPVPLPRRMWAGGDLRLAGQVREGETVTRRSVIRDVTAKSGRSGALCFVTVEHAVHSGGREILTERQDIVYRGEAGAPGSGPVPDAAPAGLHQRRITVSSALLFRYSALTFNSHRIHYDDPYVRQAEGYPGLVLHGPLQATLLAQFAESLQGSAPERFSFRSIAPLFGEGDLVLHASGDGARLDLWTARPGGPVAMQAVAQW